MANSDRPRGFRPVKSLLGVPWQGLIRSIGIGDASADTSPTANPHGNIFVGDPIKYSSGLALAANSGDTILGVAVGFGRKPTGMMGGIGPFDPSNLETNYYAYNNTNTEWVVWYVPAEGMIFEVQSSADLDALPGAELDFTTDANETHGNVTTGVSTAELKADSNSDVTVVEVPDQGLIHGLGYVDNDSTLTNTRYWVRFRDTNHLAPDPAT